MACSLSTLVDYCMHGISVELALPTKGHTEAHLSHWWSGAWLAWLFLEHITGNFFEFVCLCDWFLRLRFGRIEFVSNDRLPTDEIKGLMAAWCVCACAPLRLGRVDNCFMTGFSCLDGTPTPTNPTELLVLLFGGGCRRDVMGGC